MKVKVITLLCLIAFSTLSAAEEKVQGFETKTVFVPDASFDDIYRLAKQSREHLLKSGLSEDALENYASSMANSYIYDINKETQQGWEIKSTRRAWVNIDRSGNKKDWGTEYVLQRPTKQLKGIKPGTKRKGWLW